MVRLFCRDQNNPGVEPLYSSPVPLPNSWKNHGVLPSLFSIFLDYVDTVLTGVVLAPIILGGSFVSAGGDILRYFDLSFFSRNCVLAIIIGIYPLLQFFIAPLLGGLSDHYGRKPLLVISSIGLFLCTCMIAWGVEIGSYSKYGIIFIIFWRLIKGVFSANVGLSQSALADYAQAKGLQGNIGFTFVSFGMMTSTGSVVGGLIGGLIPIKFGFASAFFILALLYLLNTIWLLFFFKETLLQKRAKSEIRFKLWSGIENLKEAMFNISPGLTWMLYTLFFYRLGWQIFVHFSQLYIVGRFNPPHAESAIGTLWIIGMGIYCLLQYFVNQPLNKLGMGKEKPMRFTLFIQGGFILASAFAGELFPYFMLLGIAGAASNAFNSSNSAAAVGSLAPIDKKGMVLGGGQAIQGIAHLLSAFFAIVTFYLETNLLIICSGVSIIIAGFILNKGYQSIQKSRFVV